MKNILNLILLVLCYSCSAPQAIHYYNLTVHDGRKLIAYAKVECKLYANDIMMKKSIYYTDNKGKFRDTIIIPLQRLADLEHNFSKLNYKISKVGFQNIEGEFRSDSINPNIFFKAIEENIVLKRNTHKFIFIVKHKNEPIDNAGITIVPSNKNSSIITSKTNRNGIYVFSIDADVKDNDCLTNISYKINKIGYEVISGEETNEVCKCNNCTKTIEIELIPLQKNSEI